MFRPDSEIAHIANHISWLFHATIGLDPLGNFSSIDTLSYEVPVFEYNELGRNHAPVRLPLREPAQPGEVTLRWGMIVRSKLYDWIHDVEVGKDFQRHVYIFQLSRKHLPLRVYHLTGAWPQSWKTSEFSTEDKTAMSAEEVTLVYDRIDMTNLSAVAMLGELVDEPLSDAIEAMRPKSLAPRTAGLAGGQVPWQGHPDAKSFKDIWTDPAIARRSAARSGTT
jgi:phage tail-like protein